MSKVRTDPELQPGGENVEAHSAGSHPSGDINPKAIEAMREIGYDLSKHKSKSLDGIRQVSRQLSHFGQMQPARRQVNMNDPEHVAVLATAVTSDE
jgi:protein-tyrosine-phosphatase